MKFYFIILLASLNIYGARIFLAAKPHNYLNARNCIELHSFSTSNHRNPFFKCHESFDTRRNLFFNSIVCCFHLQDRRIIIVFIAKKPFRRISYIFMVCLLLPASDESTHFGSFSVHRVFLAYFWQFRYTDTVFEFVHYVVWVFLSRQLTIIKLIIKLLSKLKLR